MQNTLSRVGPLVHDEAVSAPQSQLLRHVAGGEEDASEHFGDAGNGLEVAKRSVKNLLTPGTKFFTLRIVNQGVQKPSKVAERQKSGVRK